jgi:phospholipase C
MTPGKLVIKAQNIFVGPTDMPGDYSGSPSTVDPFDPDIIRTLGERFRDRTTGRKSRSRSRSRSMSAANRKVIAALTDGLQNRRLTSISQPDDPFDPDRWPPGMDPPVGGDSGPPAEITFELFYGKTLVQKFVGKNVFIDIASSVDAWSLRITRAPDPNGQRRRYRIEASYPSIMPIDERRIPMRFLQNGFDRNWNDNSSEIRISEDGLLQMLEISGTSVFYRWNKKFSDLYGLEHEAVIPIDDLDEASFPEIIARTIRFGTGHGPDNMYPQKIVPYFSMRIDLECANSRTIDCLGPDDVDLPRKFWLEIRFLLHAFAGRMSYVTTILTDLDLEDHVMWRDVDLEGRLKKNADKITAKQWGPGGSFLDQLVGPWMIGRYELVDVIYDGATDDVVLSYVGKPVAREAEFTDAPPIALGGWKNLPLLFLTALDEKWPATPLPEMPTTPLQPASPGNLAKIDHIVVLMQENRSFDQVCGYLSRDGFPGLGPQAIEGLLPGDNNRDVNEYTFTPTTDPVKFRSTATSDTSWPFSVSGPCHGRDCVRGQMDVGMKHFVADFAKRLGDKATPENLQRIMNYYTPEALPIYAALTKDFVVCDHWFCSHIGGTLPNRHITLSGDLNVDQFGMAEEDNSDFEGYAPSERMTFFDLLEAHGVSYRVFEHGYSFLRLYRNFTYDIDRIVEFDDPDRGFEKLAHDGQLPQVSFIEPDYIELPDGNDDHAPADMYNGQRLVASIVRALIRSGNWSKTLLVITYDEHGGFYDHLLPPDEIAGDSGGAARPIPPLSNGVKQLGPRVPAIIISPLIPAPGGSISVDSHVYEHASIPAMIIRRFCKPFLPDMSPRVDAARDLRDLLTLEPAEYRKNSDFASLLQVCDAVAASPVRRNSQASPPPVPMRKIANRDDEEFKEDFGGFMAFASTVTGRGG